ncbi:hypothetical protein BUALT_Bualt15G0035400 [Buddleja alternifolia]|uniref:Alpha/beta hydrolase fold-3 domain-containing protein n=1 Tax=Buddleja alternifolia TaxID=168488 RepID=A0AAV6WMX5_9LAMI|nr:hypothetical protein BUALT_Bualt15G0035400 [Buddleja alternifolia]
MADSNSNEVLYDFPPMLRVYKDGRFERLWPIEFVPASVDPNTGVQSKDVEIAPEIGLSARIYVPRNADPAKKLPVVVYFHGGGFVVESAFSPLYQKHLNALVAEANVVAVSVNYRLAPEFHLPIAYEDSWIALKWVGSGLDKWIQDYADLGRVYLGGDSAGGNIVHNIAMRVGSENPDGIHLRGAFLNCPYFCGKDPLLNEETHELMPKSYLDNLWHYACPSTNDCDDPLINPGMDSKLSGLGCKRVLVHVAEKDVLRGRGHLYKEVLEKSGWDGQVEIVDVKGKDHVFSVFFPDSESGLAMLKKVASFINH